MEHRFSRRMCRNTEVVLFSRGSAVARGVCRDLSVDGMFVETDVGLFHHHACLEVQLPENGGMRLPALVVHRGAEGIGLSFELAGPEVLRWLQAYLRRKATDDRAPRRR